MSTPEIIRTERRGPRTVQIVRDVNCVGCGKLYGQTLLQANDRNATRCLACKKAIAATRDPATIKKRRPRNALEIVLPKVRKPRFDRKRGEWFMGVRCRKSRSDEKFQQDKVFLGLGEAASPEAVQTAFDAAFARLSLSGASKLTKEQKAEKLRKKRHVLFDKRYSWKHGRDRDLGITKHRIVTTRYKVYLPDPLVDGEKHFVGKFKTREEARKARNEKYKDLCTQVVPCAFCGVKPEYGRGRFTHISSECSNKVRTPTGLRKLFATKVWNLLYSEGAIPNAGDVQVEDLARMGYMHSPKGVRYYAREDVSWDFSLAAKYATTPPEEEEPIFE